MTGMTRRLRALLFPVFLVLALAGWTSSAQAEAGGWTQCVARSPSSGALYVGEPIDGADRARANQYRAEFIKSGQASGVAAGELNAQTAFCFFAPRQEDLSRMVADLGKPCPSCSAPYRQAPVAWNIRDILPAEIAAAGSHLVTLALSAPPPPGPDPATPATAVGGAPATPAEAPAPPPERYPIASARWRAFLCGTEVRLSYAFEAPAGSPIESVPFQGVVTAGSGISHPFDQTLSRTATVPPGCGSPQFLKVADLAEFSRDLPTRGDARLAALRQRLEDVTLQLAPPPPPPVLAEVAPSPVPPGKSMKTGQVVPVKAMAAPVVVARTAPVAQPPAATAPAKAVAVSSAPAPVSVRPPPPAPPVAAPALASVSQDPASARLNTDISNRNAEVASRNAAAAADYEKRMAAYKAAQDAFAASQTAYERSNKVHEAQVAEAARARVAWEAKVKACNAGDRAACAP